MSITEEYSGVPWVEKYRPVRFEDIVLDPNNKIIMENIVKTKYFPNLLLYGPPGTGKTTTIVNLVTSYLKSIGKTGKGLMIHLNASDERGIDIIRIQINQFVSSRPLFNDGIKFVILDEVDYMTKNAQYALKYLLQGYNKNVRFCLICNYISRIDEALQNEFVRLRFNQLPQKDTIAFLEKINICEKLNYDDRRLMLLQKIYKSDIRSMINYMQSNDRMDHKLEIIEDNVWLELTNNIKRSSVCKRNIDEISKKYNIDIISIIRDYLNYIIKNKEYYISQKFLNFIEYIMHLQYSNIEYLKQFTLEYLHKYFNEIDRDYQNSLCVT